MCAEGHTFCLGCWCQWLVRKRSCPTCRSPIDEASPLIKNRIAERMIGDLRSYCPFRTERPEKRRRIVVTPDTPFRSLGCTWQGELRNLEAHMEVCPHALSPCRVSPLCQVTLPRGKIKDHEAVCPYHRTLCGRCGRLVRTAALKHHQRSNKCHRAQSLLREYLDLLIHTANCVFSGNNSVFSSSSDSDDASLGGVITNTAVDDDEEPSSSSSEQQQLSSFSSSSSLAESLDNQTTTTTRQVALSAPAMSILQRRGCRRRDCLKMETLLRHYAKCSSRTNHGSCPSGICDHLKVLLQLHARDCTSSPCNVPFCARWRRSHTAAPPPPPPPLGNIVGVLAAADPSADL